MSWTKAWDIANDGGLITDAIDVVVELAKEGGEAAETDLRTFVSAIARDLVKARLRGEDDWERELLAELEMVGEVQRLRAIALQAEVVKAALQTATKLAARIAARIASGGLI